MATPAFDAAAFRASFPAFANETTYPDGTLSAWWDMGTNIISTANADTGEWTFLQNQLGNDLMCAHLAASFTLINAGAASGLTQSATEGSVSVSLTPPPVKSAFGYWLATTPYGAQLRALLDVVGVGGFYVGGYPETAAFRRVGGRFV